MGSLAGRSLWLGTGAEEDIFLWGEAVDFSRGKPDGDPLPVLESSIASEPGSTGTVSLKLAVTNGGSGALYRLTGRTKSERHEELDGHLAVFGKVAPGKRVERVIGLPALRDPQGKPISFEVEFREANGRAPPPKRLILP